MCNERNGGGHARLQSADCTGRLGVMFDYKTYGSPIGLRGDCICHILIYLTHDWLVINPWINYLFSYEFNLLF